ncbi:leucyl aminopeptidase [Corynebacterium imitans]|uniref:leucyl aminopeptidase n=1 Tax=Corynebacterium imitans TaxID=156978 RepID=UPI00254B43B3|nr:leucyl aminopeptidase [Corynebacterium imitans]MDK8305788.1 leucyl aminopeptidase [Corynebacterium imitans]MDK8636746.1 leucyl aminopeptidase [Corynebacterium imitans]MDK8772361.1 leucyl aminopeptidase [Corynebacterium imitans]
MAFDCSLPVRGTAASVTLAENAPAEAARLVPVAADESGPELPVTSLVTDGLLDALSKVGAKGKVGECHRLLVDGTLFIAFGIGPASDIDDEAVRRGVGTAARSLAGVEKAAISAEFGVGPVVEGIVLGSYSYQGFKAADAAEPAQVTTEVAVVDADAEAFEAARIIAESVNLARDLVNTPSNYLYPASYAKIMEEIGAQVGLKVEVFDEDYLAEHGFGGITAVGGGSQRPPRLVHLALNPEATGTHTALVGKGITFDTGGISLKPGAKMEDMISDMGGSAAQFAAIVAAARLGIDMRIDAWLPLAENMPSGAATRPGDVITHYGGLTSEVLNTDAEGRLVLADAIARASQDKPDFLIETATLTGAQMVALGARTSAVMGSDDFRDAIAETGRSLGEPAWAMPLLEEQEAQLKSPIADIRNIHNSRNGGMLFAGLYLSKFVSEGTQWAHIDIAGPSFNTESPFGYTPKRATGVPVRTIIATLSALAER